MSKTSPRFLHSYPRALGAFPFALLVVDVTLQFDHGNAANPAGHGISGLQDNRRSVAGHLMCYEIEQPVSKSDTRWRAEGPEDIASTESCPRRPVEAGLHGSLETFSNEDSNGTFLGVGFYSFRPIVRPAGSLDREPQAAAGDRPVPRSLPYGEADRTAAEAGQHAAAGAVGSQRQSVFDRAGCDRADAGKQSRYRGAALRAVSGAGEPAARPGRLAAEAHRHRRLRPGPRASRQRGSAPTPPDSSVGREFRRAAASSRRSVPESPVSIPSSPCKRPSATARPRKATRN